MNWQAISHAIYLEVIFKCGPVSWITREWVAENF